MYSTSERDETVERVYAFTDEYGAFGWDIDNPSVSTHFIITAVIVKESDLSAFTQKTGELRRKHFQTGEIKSSKVGKNNDRRLQILSDLQDIPFNFFSVCIDKKKGLESQGKKQEEGYISLTEVARAHSEDAPGYVIQSWLRSGNTLAFLNLWEQENNPNYSETGYAELLKRKKTASFTLTPKLWIDQTKAIGIVSKQGKNGGTFAHPMIACEFASWIAPEFKMQLLKLSLDRTKLR